MLIFRKNGGWQVILFRLGTLDPGRQPEQDTFYRFYQRAEERGWTVETIEGDHNVQTSHPKELVDLLEKAVR